MTVKDELVVCQNKLNEGGGLKERVWVRREGEEKGRKKTKEGGDLNYKKPVHNPPPTQSVFYVKLLFCASLSIGGKLF